MLKIIWIITKTNNFFLIIKNHGIKLMKIIQNKYSKDSNDEHHGVDSSFIHNNRPLHKNLISTKDKTL